MSGDPTRLTDGSEAPEELRNLLSAAREDVPSESQLKRVATRLGPLLGGAAVGTAAGAGAAASTSGATAGATGSVAVGVKVGAALVAAGLVGGGALWYAARSHSPAPPAPSHHAAPVKALAPPAKARPAPAPAPAASPVPAKASPAPKVSPNPKKAEPATPTHKAAPSEASLLQAAQSALKTDPHRALALAEEHRRLYPHGALSQEREVITIEALTRLGRTGEAHAKAKDFEKRYPDSAQKSKVGATVEGN